MTKRRGVEPAALLYCLWALRDCEVRPTRMIIPHQGSITFFQTQGIVSNHEADKCDSRHCTYGHEFSCAHSQREYHVLKLKSSQQKHAYIRRFLVVKALYFVPFTHQRFN